MADLSRNCKGFRERESVHARVTESRAQGTGVGCDMISGKVLRAAEVIEVCFPRIYKECPLRRTFDPLRCTSAAFLKAQPHNQHVMIL